MFRLWSVFLSACVIGLLSLLHFPVHVCSGNKWSACDLYPLLYLSVHVSSACDLWFSRYVPCSSLYFVFLYSYTLLVILSFHINELSTLFPITIIQKESAYVDTAHIENMPVKIILLMYRVSEWNRDNQNIKLMKCFIQLTFRYIIKFQVYSFSKWNFYFCKSDWREVISSFIQKITK